MQPFPRAELPHGIRALYPSWAILGRPGLPPGLAAAEVLHAPSPAAVPPLGRGQRLVVTVHDIAFLVHPELFSVRWRVMFRAGFMRAVRTADALIAVSEHTARELVRRTSVDARRVHVVPLAASLPDEASDVGKTLERLGIEAPYLLFVGTLEPRKNLPRLVRAYRRIASLGVPHSLVLAGGLGWRHERLLGEIRVPGPGRLVLAGHVGARDLDALYRGADAFVYPSIYEGFGLPVLEAMARGTPCVVSSSSSLPEVAGEAALYADPRSVGELAEAMARLVSDAELAGRLSDAGRRRASRFSWEETARRTGAVYARLLA